MTAPRALPTRRSPSGSARSGREPSQQSNVPGSGMTFSPEDSLALRPSRRPSLRPSRRSGRASHPILLVVGGLARIHPGNPGVPASARPRSRGGPSSAALRRRVLHVTPRSARERVRHHTPCDRPRALHDGGRRRRGARAHPGPLLGKRLVLGAVVSPTDPTAAAAIAERLGCRAASSLIEGESLVNDGTAPRRPSSPFAVISGTPRSASERNLRRERRRRDRHRPRRRRRGPPGEKDQGSGSRHHRLARERLLRPMPAIALDVSGGPGRHDRDLHGLVHA